jgi:hypothetical protein
VRVPPRLDGTGADRRCVNVSKLFSCKEMATIGALVNNFVHRPGEAKDLNQDGGQATVVIDGDEDKDLFAVTGVS